MEPPTRVEEKLKRFSGRFQVTCFTAEVDGELGAYTRRQITRPSPPRPPGRPIEREIWIRDELKRAGRRRRVEPVGSVGKTDRLHLSAGKKRCIDDDLHLGQEWSNRCLSMKARERP